MPSCNPLLQNPSIPWLLHPPTYPNLPIYKAKQLAWLGLLLLLLLLELVGTKMLNLFPIYTHFQCSYKPIGKWGRKGCTQKEVCEPKLIYYKVMKRCEDERFLSISYDEFCSSLLAHLLWLFAGSLDSLAPLLLTIVVVSSVGVQDPRLSLSFLFSFEDFFLKFIYSQGFL